MTMEKNYQKMADNADEAINLLKAMGNRHRLMLLCVLQEGEMSVTQLNELIPIAQSSLSQHLAWLRREGYVKTRRDAQTIYYSLDSTAVTEVIAVLHRLYCS